MQSGLSRRVSMHPKAFMSTLKTVSYSCPTSAERPDRKSTRLNYSHLGISYAVFCLKNKNYILNGELARDANGRVAVKLHRDLAARVGLEPLLVERHFVIAQPERLELVRTLCLGDRG